MNKNPSSEMMSTCSLTDFNILETYRRDLALQLIWLLVFILQLI